MLFPTKTAVIIRGLSGAGKSTFAQNIAAEHHESGCSVMIHETDNYFIKDGVYTFDRDLLGSYHQENFKAFSKSIEDGVYLVINSNTNTQLWEYNEYLKVAINNGYATMVFDLYDAGQNNKSLDERNKHGFPADKYNMVRGWYERGMENLDPRHPSQR